MAGHRCHSRARARFGSLLTDHYAQQASAVDSLPQIPENMTGKSLAPILRGETSEPHDTLCWEHQGNKAIRQGDWKLVLNHPNQPELFNIPTDRGENKNLSAQHPQRVRDLQALHTKHYRVIRSP